MSNGVFESHELNTKLFSANVGLISLSVLVHNNAELKELKNAAVHLRESLLGGFSVLPKSSL